MSEAARRTAAAVVLLAAALPTADAEPNVPAAAEFLRFGTNMPYFAAPTDAAPSAPRRFWPIPDPAAEWPPPVTQDRALPPGNAPGPDLQMAVAVVVALLALLVSLTVSLHGRVDDLSKRVADIERHMPTTAAPARRSWRWLRKLERP